MTPIQKLITNNNTTTNPIWLMRQAGRYLPEFRKIRRLNPDFINLCLNKKLSYEITLQPLKRFDFDAAIIFSDILMVPYAMNQDVKFKKNFGPILGDLNIEDILNTNSTDFKKKLKPVYDSIKKVKKNKLLKNKDVIGFVGAPWTLLVYMINKTSPKKKITKNFFYNKRQINNLLRIIDKFLKIHIAQQVKNGATIIQIFDSWAGLLDEKNLSNYIYKPNLELVNYTKSLGVPVICFPRGIKNYKRFCEIVNPSAINIDYNVNPLKISKEINIPIQGGLDPKKLLLDREALKKEILKYLNIFKDHPYIFNLGHGVLPQTKPLTINYLIEIIRNY